VRFDWMPQPLLFMDAVPVPPAFALNLEIAGFRQVIDDPLHRALGNPDSVGKIAHTGFGILRDAEQHVRMVGEKGPGTCRR